MARARTKKAKEALQQVLTMFQVTSGETLECQLHHVPRRVEGATFVEWFY